MYGKATRARFAKETAWGVVPGSPWFEAPCGNASLSAAPRRDVLRYAAGAAQGAVYAVGSFDAQPTPGNVEALAEAALARTADGDVASYTAQAADAAGARELRGAVVRRLRIRCGVARPTLLFALELIAKASAPCVSFEASPGAGHFTFHGSTATVGETDIALKEFSLNVNNNIFVGPSDGGDGAAFFSAGRQEMTGYLILAEDRRDLIDGDAHAFGITLPGAGEAASITAEAVLFTWCREIRTVSAGALQVLYFESAAGGIGAGLSIERREA